MKENNIVIDKSYNFALEIIKMHQNLIKERRVDTSILRQLLKSGTSIGANANEAVGAYSRKEFIVKFQIAYKETKETLYWLNLLADSGILEDSRSIPLIEDCEEILKIITSIIKTTKL